VAVAVQGEAHRGMAGAGRDLLGGGAGGDPIAPPPCRRSWMRNPVLGG
jgi:hypothetical protein